MDALDKLQRLKKEKNAVILAHNYQLPEVQDLADFCGDSLGLSIEAAKTDADVIVFCGVKFMAETAAILSPDKTVLLPEISAGCPMADMITAGQLQKAKDEHPCAIVVCYVNSTVEVKALSDYCCTSSNAVELVDRLPKDSQIIFVPDRNLGSYVKQQTHRDIILWPGYCPTHVMIDAESIKQAKQKHPNAMVLAHPECSQCAWPLADELLSTGQMINFVSQSPVREFIIATEVGILHSLAKKNPDKIFVAANDRAICQNMKKITLASVIESLEDNKYVIKVDIDIAAKAKKALDKMIEVLPKN